MRRIITLVAAASLFHGTAVAALTTPQQQTLKALALADATASQYVTSPSADNDRALADWFNGAGACVVWRTSVPIRDIYDKTSATGTVWDWTAYIANTTAAERDAWDAMSKQGGTINPSLPQVRDGWSKIFSGTGTAVVAQRAPRDRHRGEPPEETPMFYEPGKTPHGLPHDPFKSCVVPRPIGWISTVSREGVHNLAPFSQFQNLTFDPPYVMFASNQNTSGRRKDTVNNTEQTGEFVWNMATYALREAVNKSAEEVPSEVD